MIKKQIYDKERVSFNLVRYEKYGKKFELVVEPELAIEYKDKNKDDVEELAELLRAQQVFSDAKKGVSASEEDLELVFKTNEVMKIAQTMMSEGEIQLTQEYRDQLREEKKRKLINMIHRRTIDPKSKLPHPETRIRNALEEAKVRIDEFKKAEDQFKNVLEALKPVIPIKEDNTILEIGLSMKHASALRGWLMNIGQLKKEDWKNDGTYSCHLEIPSGIKQEVMDDLGSKTKGEVTINMKGE